MNEWFVKSKRIEWEEFGFKTTLECNEEVDAIEICGHHLHAFNAQLQPELSSLNRTLKNTGNQGNALHQHLYDRPIPVNDASMLTHQSRVRTAFILAAFAAGTCFASNVIMFWLMDWGLGAILAAIAITALPLGFGHLVYERVLSGHKRLQIVIIVIIAALGFGALYQFGQARQVVMDKAAAQSDTRSYLDDGGTDSQVVETRSQDGSERKVNGTLGGALFLVSMAAELALGFLVGLFLKLRTDEDYAAWRKLKEIHELIVKLEERIAELFSRIEVAKKQCTAGIRRARSIRSKRRIPYHKALVVFVLFAFFRIPVSHSQTVHREEGILIDVSSSISRDGKNRNLFQEYLHSAKKLLATEPANSRVWVSTIAGNSFGGVREVVRGWTPDAHGVFTDGLDRSRRQLATSFETKSASLTATAGTDIFGGLWRVKTLFESSPTSGPSSASERTIWIFSDMMNETWEFPMPQLLEIGPERMLERLRANGLLVPLQRYKIYVYGASSAGLTPRSWMTMKRFWEMYFAAAGAQLVTYSTECDVGR